MSAEFDFENLQYPWKNENGITEDIPALDPRWVELREFPLYTCLCQGEQVKLDSWCSNMEILVKRCEWLLCQPYHKFWSQVIYGDDSFQAMLDSYLMECPKYSQPELMSRCFFAVNSRISFLQKALDRKIFMILLRMSTRREAGICQSIECYGRLIYDHYLFDIPRIIDLCALFGEDNEKLVKRMVDHIFKCQPKFYQDLEETCRAMHKALDKCVKNVDATVGQSFQILNRKNAHTSAYNDKTAVDAVHFLVDLVYSPIMFLKIFPPAAKTLHDSGLTERLPTLFEKTFPPLCAAISSHQINAFNSNCQHILERMVYFEKKTVELFRQLLSYNILDPLIKPAEKTECSFKSKDDCVNEYISYMTHVVQEKDFAIAYSSIYPFDGDLDLMRKRNVDFDPFSMQFISDAFKAFAKSQLKKLGKEKKSADPTRTASETVLTTSVQDNESILQIRDIFPDLGLPFIKTCLKNYNNNVERIVNDLLTGVLNAESTMPCSSLNNFNENQKPTPLLNDVEGSATLLPLEHSKKRGNRGVLKDKSSILESKSVYERYTYENDDDLDELERNDIADEQPGSSSVFKVVNPNRRPVAATTDSDEDDESAVYNDEYDDTYDSQRVNVDESKTVDETESEFRRKKLSTPNDEESDQANLTQKCSKPDGQQRQPWKGDYTGGRDRQNKERNKGKAASHNRKNQALYKHSRGFGFY